MTRIWIAAGLVVLGAASGCGRSRADTAVTGAPPAVQSPVGPIPGPGKWKPTARSPYADDAVALQQGRELFTRFNCSGCHGGHAGGGMGPSLRDRDWIYGPYADDVFDSIAEGRAHGMPAWGVMLPQEQIWKLVAYIQALGTPAEPQPPG